MGKLQILMGALAGLTSLLLVLSKPALAQDEIELPSGMIVTLQEVLMDGDLGRFRFVAPDLGSAGREYGDIKTDFPWLCEDVILPALAVSDQKLSELVISIADRAVVFGEITPDALQFFEVFDLSNGNCTPEAF